MPRATFEESVVSMKTLLATVATATIVAVSAPASAAPDLEEGRKLAEQVCAACHGMDGASEPQDGAPVYPKIGGQYADYLVRALEDYKSGARRNAIMAGFAAGLSDADRRNLAAWYASQSGTVYTVDRD